MEQARVRILPPETAKRIAAGEVIERPASALRELLDNALDAGADSIVVELTAGGTELIRVTDNGCGMDREDLTLAAQPHATSKIRDADDLLSLSTLGFRGEALASMAAVARLEIISATEDDQAWRLRAGPGMEKRIERCSGSRGTTVSVAELFGNFPARKGFLKRPAAETAACRQVFLEKALAFPERSFRLVSDGRLLAGLLPGGLLERVLAASYADIDPVFVRELAAKGHGYSLRLVAGLPDVYRSDRRHIQIFVNKRRVQEYALAQAAEYAYRGALPGGAWPFVYVFLDVDPALADFNIHPAKREVRLKNLDELRSGIIRTLRDFMADRARPVAAPSFGSIPQGIGGQGSSAQSIGFPNPAQDGGSLLFGEAGSAYSFMQRADVSGSPGQAHQVRVEHQPLAPDDEPRTGQAFNGGAFRYLGQALGVFLVCEAGDELWLLDMHAAHERIIFDQLMAGPVPRQELLVPILREPESDDEDRWLSENRETLARAGYAMVREGSAWLLTAMPAAVPGSKAGGFFELLRSRPNPEDLYRAVAASSACRAAVMDGDRLEPEAARSLIARAVALPDPHCPHGRPIWVRLSRDELYRAVRRTL